MTQLTVTRNWCKDEYIIGRLYVNGQLWCDTLERPRYFEGRENVRQKCCIPAGSYKVIMKQSAKFGRKLPLLCDVPNRSQILIHSGNSVQDSEGCLLAGENKEKGKVLNSRYWVNKICQALKYETDIRITIKYI